MPRVHNVAALLKRVLVRSRWVQHQHLDYYLDEFTFRFNRRRSSARGLLFHRLAHSRSMVRHPTVPLFTAHRWHGDEGDTPFICICLSRIGLVEDYLGRISHCAFQAPQEEAKLPLV